MYIIDISYKHTGNIAILANVSKSGDTGVSAEYGLIFGERVMLWGC
jgi:hypothetical protein